MRNKGCSATREADNDYIDWLLQHAMLEKVKPIAASFSGKGRQWKHPYGEAQSLAAAELASVWFTSYPSSTVTGHGQSVLAFLGDSLLWQLFADMGIEGLHTGPMKRAGGIDGGRFYPTTDGFFDRIGLDIDPLFGNEDEYQAMVHTADMHKAHGAQHGAIIIDDIVPGHTGKGADFRLAELNLGAYPGLYHMVEISEEHWSLLPTVPLRKDSANLPPSTVDLLHEMGYIVGRLERVIFEKPGVKDSNWSATAPVTGIDGITRRWVYLHYFKDNQPTLNWLDPSFAAQRLVTGDALHTLDTLGARMLRLDANGFLGIEVSEHGMAWSEGHPLSQTANQLIASMVRKAGGYTFQELNLTIEDIAKKGGADLSYDFISRPACQHALVTGDAEFLYLMLQIAKDAHIDPASLVHALQNHDELTLELVHFSSESHNSQMYHFRGTKTTGSQLRDIIRNEMKELLTGENAPYNLLASNGVSCTMASIAAATLGIRSVEPPLDDSKVRMIQQLHLLLAMFNALQPGVFALSGWDLVGALPLSREVVEKRIKEDGDTRWINRGAYDLMGSNPTAKASAYGLPMARALYGSIPEQLDKPDSFVNQLQRLLKVRKEYGIYRARQIDILQHSGLLVMVHQLPQGIQLTALNFGKVAVNELLPINGALSGNDIWNMIDEKVDGEVSADGKVRIKLGGHAGKSLLIHQIPVAARL